MTGEGQKVADRGKRRWSQAEMDELRVRVAAGEKLVAIAAAMGRSPAAVSKMRGDLGLDGQRRGWSDADTGQLRAMVAAGASVAECGAALGRSKAGILQRARILGLRFCPVLARARLSVTKAAQWRDSEYRAKATAGMRRAYTPERRARARAVFIENNLQALGVAAVRAEGPEARAARRANLARATEKRIEKQLAWCPVAYRDLYREMVQILHSAPDARRVVEAQIAADNARNRARGICVKPVMTAAPRRSFEELLAAVAAGEVALTERIPVRRPPTHVPGAASSLAGAL
jgi:hypothetical protein